MTDDRAEMQANREAGLRARHETRVERAREREAEFVQAELWKVANTARREVAEEIALALEERRDSFDWSRDRKGGLTTAAVIAREIGAKETS